MFMPSERMSKELSFSYSTGVWDDSEGVCHRPGRPWNWSFQVPARVDFQLMTFFQTSIEKFRVLNFPLPDFFFFKFLL
jgi:hypothetical protein